MARQTFESWDQTYPRDGLKAPRFLGRPSRQRAPVAMETAVEEGLKAIEIDPNYSIGYENVTFAYFYMDRLSEAEALLAKPRSARSKHWISHSPVQYRLPKGGRGEHGKGGRAKGMREVGAGVVRTPEA